MRYTFYTQDFATAESAIRDATRLVEELFGDLTPPLSAEDGDGGYCLAYESRSEFQPFNTTILVIFNSPDLYTVEGFIYN